MTSFRKLGRQELEKVTLLVLVLVFVYVDEVTKGWNVCLMRQ